MFVIGLTGSFATGKSTVAGMFRKLGATVLDADKTAKKLLWRDSPCFKKVVKVFGDDILVRGRINKRKLAGIIFSDASKRHKLEKIIHPQVAADFKRRLAALKKNKRCRYAVLDVPLLFEAKMNSLADVTVAVKATRSQQMSRALKIHKLNKNEINRRISAQMPLKDKIRKSDYCIDNTGKKIQTQIQVNEIWQKLQQMVKK